jgi:hypothetical protein
MLLLLLGGKVLSLQDKLRGVFLVWVSILLLCFCRLLTARQIALWGFSELILDQSVRGLGEVRVNLNMGHVLECRVSECVRCGRRRFR